MNALKQKILIINGSYRNNGITDQIITEISSLFIEKDIEYEIVLLRDKQIRFCSNCRTCTQEEGMVPAKCVQNDEMASIIDKIESSNGFVIASPTNYYTVTAIFKRFLERLIVYGYWPWGKPAPELRKKTLTKKSVLISSCAAPSFIGRFFTGTIKQLKACSTTIGAKPIGSLFLGLIAMESKPILTDKQKHKAKNIGKKLVESIG